MSRLKTCAVIFAWVLASACGDDNATPPPPVAPPRPAEVTTPTANEAVPPTGATPGSTADISQHATVETLKAAMIHARSNTAALFAMADPEIGLHYYSWSSSHEAATFCSAATIPEEWAGYELADAHAFTCDAPLHRCVSRSGDDIEYAFRFSDRPSGGRYLLQIIQAPSMGDGDPDADNFVERAQYQCRFLGALLRGDGSISSRELWVFDGATLPSRRAGLPAGATTHDCGAAAAAALPRAVALIPVDELSYFYCQGLQCFNEDSTQKLVARRTPAGAFELLAVELNVPSEEDGPTPESRTYAAFERHILQPRCSSSTH